MSNLNAQKIVDLQKLVQHPQSLKLLILHTPYTLQISSLSLCSNLIKLDLSKNNLQSFPYIGNLCYLKFMFLHQNKLDHQQLRNVFYRDQQDSLLARTVVWVTFWGNKNTFLARHFLVNQTHAIAVDHHIVLPQQRKSTLTINGLNPFDQITQIQDIFTNKTNNKSLTQQQYMDQFWQQMRYIRKKFTQVFPIIKFQSLFRGWILRKKIKQKTSQILCLMKSKSQIFNVWKKQTLRQKYLFNFLKSRKKQHYLLPCDEMQKQNIRLKILEWCERAKHKVLLRKISLKSQVRFYAIIRSNYLMFKSLYQQLEITNSTFVLIDKNSYNLIQNQLKQFIRLFNGQDGFTVHYNKQYIVRNVNQGMIKKQFMRLISMNQKSYMIKTGNQRKNTKSIGSICSLPSHQTSLKPLYPTIHLSSLQYRRYKSTQTQLQKRKTQMLQDFLILKGSQRVLKDIIRCVYFIDTQVIQMNIKMDKKIQILTQAGVRKLTAVTLLQKYWRGHVLRNKFRHQTIHLLKTFRATVRIQRWVRGLSLKKRQQFKKYVTHIIKSVNNRSFYIQMSDYFNIIQAIEENSKHNKMQFLQQSIIPSIDLIKQKFTLHWNSLQAPSKQNQTISQCINANKIPFDSKFLQSLFKNGESLQYFSSSSKQSQNIQKGEISHIFHFNTLTSITNRDKKSYIRITCNNILQAKIRIFAILLKSFNFIKGFTIKIHINQFFHQNYKQFKRIVNRDSIFITKANVQLNQKSQKIQKYHFKAKIYFTQQTNVAPIKLQQNLLIFVPTYLVAEQSHEQIQKDVIKYQKQQKQQKQQKKIQHKSSISMDQLYFSESQISLPKQLSSLSSINQNPIKKSLMPHVLKRILPLKKQIRSYKIQKRIKPHEPSFILDNSNKKQRFKTQSDVIDQTQQIQKDEQSIQLNRIQHSNTHYSTIKQKLKKQYQYRKDLVKKQKEDLGFHHNFMNLNNFLQQQNLSQQRRRIKTQLQLSAYESADRIRISHQKSNENMLKKQQIKKKHILTLTKQHKQVIQKHNLLKDKANQQLKRTKSVQRNRSKSKNQIKRIKVSFAQECFPMINRRSLKRNQQLQENQ